MITENLFLQRVSILADGDCPSDWEKDDLLEFAQEASRRLLAIGTLATTATGTIEDVGTMNRIGRVASGEENV